MTPSDAIDTLLGLSPSVPLTRLRDMRPDVRQYSQGSFDALLEPADETHLSRIEREAVALRLATQHACGPLMALHRARLGATGATAEALDAVALGTAHDIADDRLAAMLQHADLLGFEPIAARPAHLAALAEAGLTPAAIVTLSQLIGFVSYQVRVVAGLELLRTAA